MIRILHSVSYMNRGGIENMLMNYYRHIDRNKIQFDFVCNSFLPGAFDDEIKSLGGRIFRSPGFSPLKYGQYKQFMHDLFASHPEYSIIEAHNGPLGRFPLKAAKDFGIPVRIYHAHGSYIPFDLKWPLKFYCKRMLRYSMNQHFVCGTKAGEFYMGKKIMDAGDYHFIHNAIDTQRFLYNESIRYKMRKEYGLNDKLVIGHIGNFSLPKNHPFILKVFAKLHEINPKTFLVLVGEGKGRSNIEKIINDYGIGNSVLLTGSVSNTYEWYQTFDLFMMPSLYEGLPVVGIEAQAADLPCVFSTSVTSEIALSDKVDFIDLKESVEYWAKKIDEKLKKLPIREDCTDLITEKGYNIEVEAKKLQSLYISLSNNKK